MAVDPFWETCGCEMRERRDKYQYAGGVNVRRKWAEDVKTERTRGGQERGAGCMGYGIFCLCVWRRGHSCDINRLLFMTWGEFLYSAPYRILRKNFASCDDDYNMLRFGTFELHSPAMHYPNCYHTACVQLANRYSVPYPHIAFFVLHKSFNWCTPLMVTLRVYSEG